MCAALCGCHEVDDDRIPNMPVNISLADAGMWNTYGVAGFGMSRDFILGTTPPRPAGFPYTVDSRTGFGGVLLVGGMNAFTLDTSVPLAYDLACPVERDPEIRVAVSADTYEAVCPVCHSRYDVTMGAGAPLSGPAAAKKLRYSLRRYQCYPTQYGGYVVGN